MFNILSELFTSHIISFSFLLLFHMWLAFFISLVTFSNFITYPNSLFSNFHLLLSNFLDFKIVEHLPQLDYRPKPTNLGLSIKNKRHQNQNNVYFLIYASVISIDSVVIDFDDLLLSLMEYSSTPTSITRNFTCKITAIFYTYHLHAFLSRPTT